MNPPPCRDWTPYEDEDGDIGPVIRAQATQAERTRWLGALKILVTVFGLYVVGCVAGAMGGTPWCE